jgi:hypothetical protein
MFRRAGHLRVQRFEGHAATADGSRQRRSTALLFRSQWLAVRIAMIMMATAVAVTDQSLQGRRNLRYPSWHRVSWWLR